VDGGCTLEDEADDAGGFDGRAVSVGGVLGRGSGTVIFAPAGGGGRTDDVAALDDGGSTAGVDGAALAVAAASVDSAAGAAFVASLFVADAAGDADATGSAPFAGSGRSLARGTDASTLDAVVAVGGGGETAGVPANIVFAWGRVDGD
jgi:hypothetical protein